MVRVLLVKVHRPAGVLWVSSAGPVVILLLYRIMWSNDVNKVVMECHLKSKPVNENGVPIREYRQRMILEVMPTSKN